MYGSLKRTGMQRVLDCLAAKCQMGKSSHLVDIGAGLGRCSALQLFKKNILGLALHKEVGVGSNAKPR